MSDADQPSEDAPADDEPTLEGASIDLADDATRTKALEEAFDYRGDVTLTLRDGRAISGYLFDRHVGADVGASSVRIMPIDTTDRVEVAFADIATVTFTGRDTAHGKSWETWVRKQAEKKEHIGAEGAGPDDASSPGDAPN